MNKYFVVYIGAATDEQKEQANPEQDQAFMQAWMEWANKHQVKIVDQGSPLGKTKRVSKEGVADFKNALTGYTVVQAASHEAAAEMFVDHPHITFFPDNSIEVMACFEIPG